MRRQADRQPFPGKRAARAPARFQGCCRWALRTAQPVALVAGGALAAGCMRNTHSPDALAVAFRWNEANAAVAQASTPEMFGAAAERYAELASMDVRDGRLFYNQGTAWLMAGDFERARRCLLRAERHLGATRPVRRNLMMCEEAAGAGRSAPHAWRRVLFFWHYALGLQTRVDAAFVAFAFFCFALTLARLGYRRTGRRLRAAALALCVLFACSSACTLFQERADAGRGAKTPADGRRMP